MVKIKTTFLLLVLASSSVVGGFGQSCRFDGYPDQIIRLGEFDESTQVGELLVSLTPNAGSTFHHIFQSKPTDFLSYDVDDFTSKGILPIKLAKSLDLDVAPYIGQRHLTTLGVVCDDDQVVDFQVEFTVKDLNDNCPSFEKANYSSVVNNKWSASRPLNSEQIIVTDLDFTLANANLVFESTKKNKILLEPQRLSVSPPWKYSLKLKLVDGEQLQPEVDEEPFEIIVSDGNCRRKIDYSFTVERINLYAPIFEEPEYTVEIEGLPVSGYVINANIFANDDDDSPFGYFIEPENNIVQIDKETGKASFKIDIKKEFIARLGTHKIIQIPLMAKETDLRVPVEKQKSSKAVLNLLFNYEDPPVPPKNPPVFEQSLYSVEIEDYPSDNAVIGVNVRATDPDGTQFAYEIGVGAGAGIVDIDPINGTVHFARDITPDFIRDLGKHKVVSVQLIARETVEDLPVEDLPVEDQLYSTSTLLIYFNARDEPVTNSPPIFHKSFYTVVIDGEPESNQVIPAGVNATDPEGSIFRYSVGNESTHDIVDINNRNGMTWFKRKIDWEFIRALPFGIVQVQLIARETESPYLHSSTALSLIFTYRPPGSSC